VRVFGADGHAKTSFVSDSTASLKSYVVWWHSDDTVSSESATPATLRVATVRRIVPARGKSKEHAGITHGNEKTHRLASFAT
jgi:hypothetical protein